MLELQDQTKQKTKLIMIFKHLIKTWNGIKDTALNSIAPTLIHQESDIIKENFKRYVMMKIQKV